MTHAVIEPHPVCLYGFGSFVRMLKRTSSPTTIMRESSPIARSHCSWTATALATKFLENRAGWLQRGRNSSGKPQIRLGLSPFLIVGSYGAGGSHAAGGLRLAATDCRYKRRFLASPFVNEVPANHYPQRVFYTLLIVYRRSAAVLYCSDLVVTEAH